MKLVKGDPPRWKSKPKANPLDTEVEFLKLQSIILTGKLGPFEQIGRLNYEDADGKRLKTKHPARLVRDRLNRVIKNANLGAEYEVTTRQTDTPGEWGVWVKHEPPEAFVAIKLARGAVRDCRPTFRTQEQE